MAVKQDGPGAAPRSREGQLEEKSLLSTIGLVAGVLGITSWVFGLLLWAIDPSTLRIIMVNAIFGLSALLFYVVTNRSSIGRIMSGRSTTLAILEGVQTVAMIGAVIAANYFGAKLTKEWDLTHTQRFSLAAQSRQVAERLNKKIKVIGFYRSADSQRKQLSALVELYSKHTDKLSVSYIAPERITPALQNLYKLTSQSARIVLVDENDSERQTKIATPTEEAFTNALIRLAERPQRTVYFLVGHGEPSIEDEKTDSGYKRAAQALIDEGFKVDTLSLLENENVKSDASVLVMPGPKKPLFTNEVQAIEDWLKRGGRLLLMLEPGIDPGLDSLYRRFGIDVGDDLVIDPAKTQSSFGPDAPMVTKFEQHPITAPLIRNPTAVVFYWVRSVRPRVGIANTDVATLIQTSETSWAEKSFREGGDMQQDEADLAGPVPVAIAVTRGTQTAANKVTDQARIVVFGDSSFANNRFILAAGNGDLFVNSVNWLAGEEQQITIRPKDADSSRWTPSEDERVGIAFFCVNLIPLLIVGIGFSVWAVRRRK